MSFMIDEIHEQPQLIQKVLDAERENVRKLCRAMKEREINLAIIAARGTSDNAALFAKYLIEIHNGIPVALAAPSVITLYGAKFDLSHALVLGISQSGESTDVVEVIRSAREMGALTACITNVPGSELTEASDHTLLCHAGEEKSVAATKTYTTTLALIYMISGIMAGEDELIPQLESAAGMISRVFQVESRIEEIAQRYRYMEECKVVARGINYATSKEAALKLAETCYVSAESFSMADLMHGPIAVVDAGFPVFMYAPQGKGFPTMVELAQKLEGWDVETIVFSSEEEILKLATIPVNLPVAVEETYSPLVYIVAAQLFAQYLSGVKGHDPDHPRGLCKVTLTM
jgi:glucosamine--fructose-6-phosphate aminotransferase (isomerizing)